MSQKWISLPQAATLLDCGPELLERWVDAGGVRARGIGPSKEICLQVETAPTLEQLASSAREESLKTEALALALANLAQRQLQQTRRYLRLAVVALAIGAGTGLWGAHQYQQLEIGYRVASSSNVEIRRQLNEIIAEREQLTQALQQSWIESAALRARIWNHAARDPIATTGVMEQFTMLLDLP